MTTKIIYHQASKGINCPDGFAAAWVAHRVYPDAEIIGCWYQCDKKDLPVVEEGDRLIIVDFSFPSEIIQEWMGIGAEILLIDHHKTALEHLGFLGKEHFSESVRSQYIFDMSKCGAVLTWEHFFPTKQVPLFLKYVQDRDLWLKELAYTEEIHEAISKLGRSFALFDLLYEYPGKNTLFEALAAFGEVLLLPKRLAIAAAADRAEPYEIDEKLGLTVPVVFLAKDGSEDRLTSDICEELYKNRFQEAAWVACITSNGAWSLRSDKNKPDGGFDVGALAKSKGGGGHRNAAGFTPNNL